jgi:hypothetical protein
VSTRIINTLAKRTVEDRQVLILDSRKCIKNQMDSRKCIKNQIVTVHTNGRLVKARIISAGEWPIAVCCNGKE